MHEINTLYPQFKPKTFLDFGAGLVPSGLSISELYPGCKISAIEPEESMRQLGKFIAKEYNNITYFENLFDSLVQNESNTFDLINCSFVLEEIRSPEERILVINNLFERLDDNGFMMFVLPGGPMGFRYLQDLRNFFISK